MNLNPGIARTVQWLNSQGFMTTDSGDGATHDHECDRDHETGFEKLLGEP